MIALLTAMASIATLSAAAAADVRQPVVVAPAPLAPVIVAPRHPLLHPALWCAGGIVISIVVDSAVPAAIGCTIGAAKLVHAHAYGAYY
jgi:hypothetical protein